MGVATLLKIVAIRELKIEIVIMENNQENGLLTSKLHHITMLVQSE